MWRCTVEKRGRRGVCRGKVAQQSGTLTSSFLGGRSQFDNVLIGGLTNYIFVLLSRRDACEFGVYLLIIRDLQHGGAVLDDPGQEVGPSRDLEDVLDVGQIILSQLVALLQVVEPVLGAGDAGALLLRDGLFTGTLQQLQVFICDDLGQVAQQGTVLRHGPGLPATEGVTRRRGDAAVDQLTE